MQDKDSLEKIFGNMGVKPVLREKMGEHDLFIGDGFSQPPHLKWQAQGAVAPEEFPAGPS